MLEEERDPQIKRMKNELIRTASSRVPDERREASGLLSLLGRLLGKGPARYVDVHRPEGSGRSITETGIIDEQGNKIPDKKVE